MSVAQERCGHVARTWRPAHCRLSIAIALVGLGGNANRASGQGIYISSVGPANRGMGGASTAAPLEALGAAYWNPAAIAGLESSELGFGMELVASNHQVTSSAGGMSGSSEASNGVFPIPSVAWIHRTSNPGLVLGLAVTAVAGLKTNLQADPANPVLMPPPNGLGRISSEASFFQFTPMVSIALSRSLAAGVGPILTLGQVAAEPFVFAPPNTDGTYSPARATHYHWGGGAQVGVYYAGEAFRLGASFKTPAWMETFEFFGEDAEGGPRLLRLDLDLPAIFSLGAAYIRPNSWAIALDLRYFDYGHTDGLEGPAAFDATGALQGLGWRGIVSGGIGVQRRLSSSIDVRAGYAYNQNPIQDENSFFNLASPLIYQHTLTAGFSILLARRTSVNLAYSYFLPEEVAGPIVSPATGPVPGSLVRNTLDVHVVSVGVSTRY